MFVSVSYRDLDKWYFSNAFEYRTGSGILCCCCSSSIVILCCTCSSEL